MMTPKEELHLKESRCKLCDHEMKVTTSETPRSYQVMKSHGGQYYGENEQMPPSNEIYFGEHEQAPPSNDMEIEDATPVNMYEPETGLWFTPQEYLTFTMLRMNIRAYNGI